MNIAPVSFGRTVRVNAPYHITKQAANLVNDFNVSPAEKNVQKQLKAVFSDRSKDGEARVISFNDRTSYILSGDESEKANKLRYDMEEYIEAAGEYYGSGPLFDITKDVESERYEDLIKLLISETEDGTALNIDYDSNNNQIKSINFVA